VAWAEAYLRTKWHLDPSSHLDTIIQLFRHNGHRPKTGGCRPLFRGGESWLPSNTMSTGLRPISVPSEILIYPLSGHNTWDENWGGGAGIPFNTKSPGRRPISVPSRILIHPAAWPQYVGRKLGAAVHPLVGEGELGSHLTQCQLGQGLVAS